MKRVVFTWGRFNPPTIGHKKLLDNSARIARYWGGDFFIYTGQTYKKPKDPLKFERKVQWMRQIFPEYANNIIYDPKVNTFIVLLQKLQNDYDEVVWVAGSDRVSVYKNILENYNGKEFYFNMYRCISAGTRDPDAEGAAGMSASKMRDAAKEIRTTDFMKGIPNSMSSSQKIQLMQEVREGMGLK